MSASHLIFRCLAGLWFAGAWAAFPADIDFSKTTGVIRPLHGVNLGPLCYRGMVDLSAYHRELAIPFTRLHDVVWVNAEAVDIHTVFPDFRNDPARPDNYRFAATDDYLQSIVAVGSQIIYRLGESIEHTKRQYHVHPPADPDRWAAICTGIVRHYNEGWADGLHLGVRYWEIWNEPDVRPQMWTGTDEEFFRLFAVTARRLKTEFPTIKIGGPAVGGTGEFHGDGFVPAPFLAKFLSYCREHQVPLDFLSWHRYTADPWDLPRRAVAMRRLLDEQGFRATESHLNEWNYLPGDDWTPLSPAVIGRRREQWFAELGGPKGAAFAATALALLQDSPVDVANYYTGEIQGFGLFDFHGQPRKTYFAFKAFRALLDSSVRMATPASVSGGLTWLAGLDPGGTGAAVLLVNFNSADSKTTLTPRHLPWSGATRYDVQRVDATHDLELGGEGQLESGGSIELHECSAPSVVLVKLHQAK